MKLISTEDLQEGGLYPDAALACGSVVNQVNREIGFYAMVKLFGFRLFMAREFIEGYTEYPLTRFRVCKL